MRSIRKSIALGYGNTAGYALNIVGYVGNKSTMRLIASNCIVPSTTLVDMYENIDGYPFNWDDLFPGFNDGDSHTCRKYLSVAIDQGSVSITLDCDKTKVMDAYRLRDPRLCLNVITHIPSILAPMPVPILWTNSLFLLIRPKVAHRCRLRHLSETLTKPSPRLSKSVCV